jgi:hypothetical protein
MNIVGPGGLFLCASVLLAILGVMALARGQPKRPLKTKATRCPSTPMITGSLDTMIRIQEESQRARY